MKIVLLSIALVACAGAQPLELTLQRAEEMALKNHPRIEAAGYTSLAVNEVVAQAESGRKPFVSASVTGAAAPEDARIAAGALNNPVIFSRFATGMSVNQLLTDFGRTSKLIESSRLASSAESERARATRADILLDVRRSYFSALRAATLVSIAQQTIEARQLLVDQVSALVDAQLKSSLDLSVAQTNLAEAKLLLASAENERDAMHAHLAEAIGLPRPRPLELVEVAPPPVEPVSVTELTNGALRNRPEIAAARFDSESLSSTAAAEKALRFPAITATAGAGLVPGRIGSIPSNYVAGGLNISLPFLNGGLYDARRREAEYRAMAAHRRTREIEHAIAREVAVAMLNVDTARERVVLTEQFIAQATQALELAQTRYDLGLSSIVELSQAQLVKTNAEIQHASARYEYQIRRAVLSHSAGLVK